MQPADWLRATRDVPLRPQARLICEHIAGWCAVAGVDTFPARIVDTAFPGARKSGGWAQLKHSAVLEQVPHARVYRLTLPWSASRQWSPASIKRYVARSDDDVPLP